MEAATRQKLEHAKGLCYSWRIVEAYSIFRKFFDRLPFKVEEEHAEYIGLFVRVLLELGKEYELKFYMTKLEELHATVKSPAVAYQLGYVYVHLKEPKTKTARQIFEAIVDDPDAAKFHVKAKLMLLSDHQDAGNLVACRQILDSIAEPLEDSSLTSLVRIWRALICRDEGNYDEGIRLLKGVLATVALEDNWYVHFSAKISLAKILLKKGDVESCKTLLVELRAAFTGKRLKSIEAQMAYLEQLLSQQGTQELRLIVDGHKQRLAHGTKTLELDPATQTGKILSALAKRGSVSKDSLVKALCGRAYIPGADDALLSICMHRARRKLSNLGLPDRMIKHEAGRYRLVPKVEILKES